MKRIFSVLAAVLAASCAPLAAPPDPVPVAAVAPQSLELPASNDRKVAVTVWRAARPKGVILFGHRHGGEPTSYQALIDRFVARGYSVVAPLSVDSRAYADRAKFDMPAGFSARVEDLMITRGYIQQAFAGQRVALAGHSYGSLLALIGAGAVTPAGALEGPPVAAVLAFSSPGAIPQLISAKTYAGVSAPVMMVTGDKDIVPSFVPDARAHRLPFETSPAGDKYLVTVGNGTHDLAVAPEGAAFGDITRLSLAFLDTYVARDPAARKQLARAASTPLYSVEKR